MLVAIIQKFLQSDIGELGATFCLLMSLSDLPAPTTAALAAEESEAQEESDAGEASAAEDFDERNLLNPQEQRQLLNLLNRLGMDG